MQVLESSDIGLEKNLEFWEVDDNDSAGENYGGSDLSDYIDSDGDDDGLDIDDDHEDSQKNTPSFADTERKSGGVKGIPVEPDGRTKK